MGDIVKALDPLFNPRSVAVIGASNNWNKWGNSTFASVLSHFEGPVHPINPREREVLGRQAYKSVLDVPEAVDLAVFVIPAARVPSAMEECVAKGVRAGVIISAGFRETGEEGRRLEDEVLRIARTGGLRFVGPNCMGMWSAPAGLSAYMFALPSMDGPAAFVTQGGNVGGSIVISAYGRGLGFRHYVSCGPAADIQLEDYIEYFGADDGVNVILAYIEGLADGQRFLEKVATVTLHKPVIVYKPGRSEAVAKAIRSHSGSLAGSDEIFDKAMKKAGVLRVESPEELLDAAIGFLTQPLPKGRNVGIITGGGSYGVICTEDCAREGLEVPELPPATIEALSAIFPPRWSHGNPVDPAGDRNFIGYYLAPKIILELSEIDALIFMGFGSLAGFGDILNKTRSTQLFIHRIPEMLSGLEDLEGLAEVFAGALSAGDRAAIRAMTDPVLPLAAQFLGTDTQTLERFNEILFSGSQLRQTLADIVRSAARLSSRGDDALPEILELLDGLISALLAHFMKTYRKPIVSTTFMEFPQVIKGASHPYTTSAKAVRVLARLVEYREHLERHGAFTDPLQVCALLKAGPAGGVGEESGLGKSEIRRRKRKTE